MLITLKDDLVAQLVEHHTFNVGVLGSSPSGVTNRYIVQLVEYRSPKPKVVGSSPSASAMHNMVYVAQLVRASDCGSEGRGFESHHSPTNVAAHYNVLSLSL